MYRLADGGMCAQFFVDFFRMPHRTLAPNDNTGVEAESTDLDLPEETWMSLKDTLT